jgi:hypothetical protein
MARCATRPCAGRNGRGRGRSWPLRGASGPVVDCGGRGPPRCRWRSARCKQGSCQIVGTPVASHACVCASASIGACVMQGLCHYVGTSLAMCARPGPGVRATQARTHACVYACALTQVCLRIAYADPHLVSSLARVNMKRTRFNFLQIHVNKGVSCLRRGQLKQSFVSTM